MITKNFIKLLNRGITLKSCRIQNSFVRSLSGATNCQPTDSVQTMDDVRSRLRRIMGVKRGYQPKQESRAYLLDLLPKSQEELPTRSMKDSFDRALIPLCDNIVLQEKYVNFMGSVRFGRLMEDLDLFAVHLVFKHLLNPKLNDGDITPAIIVTILVDELQMSDNIIAKPEKDIRLSGHVSWAGKSSVEVTVWIEQNLQGTWSEITRAIFVMAARNSTNTSSSFINKLVPADEEEKLLYAKAEQRFMRRKTDVNTSLLKLPPTAEEQGTVHDLFLKSCDLKDVTLNRRVLPENGVWMNDTKLSNILFSHPEDRNLHNKIFGGFLMRNAVELAFMTAFSYCHQRPRLVYSSGITFNQPVDVGSLLQMTGQVVYTKNKYIQITVYAQVYDPFTAVVKTTNVFNYTYLSTNNVRQVVPNTYSEAMMYIDGKRNFHLNKLT